MNDTIEMKRASDLMVPLDKYPRVNHRQTLKETILLIESCVLDVCDRKSLPRIVLVFDDREQLVGQVRRRDIMRGLEPEFLAQHPIEHRKMLYDVKVDPNLAELTYDRLIKGMKEKAQRPVSDVMLPIIATVDYNDHLIKIVYEMVDNNLSLLPVLKNDKVVGVIRSIEVFREVADLVL